MRAVFIVSSDQKNVLWSKRFPSVESRAKTAKVDPVGEDEDVAAAFFRSFAAHNKAGEVRVLLSIFSLSFPFFFFFFSKTFCVLRSPMVVFASCTVGFVVGFPLLGVGEDCSRLLASPSIALGLDSVCQIASFVNAYCAAAPSAAPPHLFWVSFGATLSMAMPLGTLIRPLAAAEALATLLKSSTANNSSAIAVDDELKMASDGSAASKTPCWRVVDATTPVAKRMRVVISVEETIECNQYDKALGAVDSSRLTGRVLLLSDVVVAGCSAPELSLKVRLWKNSPPDQRDWLGKVGSQPTSISSDSSMLTFTTLAGQGPDTGDRICHMSLCPALKTEHVLMRYEASPPTSLPFRAFYQMKPVSQREAKLLIQMKLNDRLPNSFEYCNVMLPFQAAVDSFEVSPTEGSVKKGADGRSLVWELGTSVQGRKLECALPVTVRFSDPIVLSSAAAVSPACFADIRFKMLGVSLAGVQVEDDVTCFPKPNNMTVTVSYVALSGTYRVWNSLGESVRYVAPPDK
jgi:hypothetical protein